MAVTSPFRLPPLLRDAPVAVASLDLEGHVLDANRGLLEAAGYSLDELCGQSFAAFLNPEDVEAARASFSALASGAMDRYRAERQYRARSGDLVDVELHVVLVRDGDGRPQSCLAVLQDVSAHKRALREAARRTAELEAVIQSMPAAIYIGDETGVKIANGVALREIGVDSLQELNQPVSTLVEWVRPRDPATGARIDPSYTPFSKALAGQHVDVEVVLTHLKTGAPSVQHVIAAPIVQDGRVVGAVAVHIDVTQRKATEEALKLSEARYRELVEQAPLSIQILSPDGKTLQVNKAWERLWGVTLADLAQYNLLEDRQLMERGLMPFIRRAFDGEAAHVPAALYDPNLTLETRSSLEDPRRWVRAVIYPLKGGSGEVREVVLVHEDITEQVRADAERREVERDLERLLAEAQRAHSDAEAASRVKDEFLAVLSHELRTPLNAVLGWARILRSRPLGDQTTHAVEVIERNAAAQARLIDELLDLSRIITGKIRLNLEPVDVGRIAASALESVKPAADAKRIALELRVADGLPRVTADAERLQQVLWNLLSNAVKFTESDGQVTVMVGSDARRVFADVIDTGIGIDAEILPFVFDRFTQADSSSTRAHAGLGLGLAIVRHLIELHGGTVRAESGGLGKGARFRFTLPRW